MQQAAYGIFKKGMVMLNEAVIAPGESGVVVVFLDKQANKQTKNENELLKIFETLGAWEDSRNTEAIITEIENSRVSRKTDIAL